MMGLKVILMRSRYKNKHTNTQHNTQGNGDRETESHTLSSIPP